MAAGLAKVDIGTALNMAMTASVRHFLADHPEAVDSPYLSRCLPGGDGPGVDQDHRRAHRRHYPRLTAFSTTNFGSLATSRLLPNSRRSVTW